MADVRKLAPFILKWEGGCAEIQSMQTVLQSGRH